MFIRAVSVGPFAANCYILGCEVSREGALLDPGDEADRILAAVEAEGLKLGCILITHAHLDHIGALAAIKRASDVPICIHPADLPLYKTLPEQGKMFGLRCPVPPSIDRLLHAGDTVSFGNLSLSVIHTPGHTPGGICFHGRGTLFVGDTLFAGSIGRTDLPGGSYSTLIHSIKSQLLSLDDSTRVYPGHGPVTSIGEERRTNPFLQPGFNPEYYNLE